MPKRALLLSLVLGTMACVRGRSEPLAPLRCTLTPAPSDPPLPSKEEVVSQMERLAPHIKACAAQTDFDDSVLTLRYRVHGPSGRVTWFDIAHGSRALHACVQKPISSICFTPFEAEVFKVQFPFKTP